MKGEKNVLFPSSVVVTEVKLKENTEKNLPPVLLLYMEGVVYEHLSWISFQPTFSLVKQSKTITKRLLRLA